MEGERAIHPAELIQYLLHRNIITTAEVVDRGVQLSGDMRERSVLRALAIGGVPTYMVKQARVPETVENILQELRVYSCLEKIPELNGSIPPLITADADRGLLVLGWVGKDGLQYSHLPREEMAALLGDLMGKLHALTRNIAGQSGMGDRPWILSSLGGNPRWLPEELPEVMARASKPDLLKKGLKYGEKAWASDALIHGDLKQEHCLLVDNGTQAALCLIDWELAGYGDSAWDVGSIISDILFDHGYEQGSGAYGAAEIVQEGSIGIFFHFYSQHCLVDSDFLYRVAVFTGARLLQTSMESAAAYGMGTTSGVDMLVAMAEQILSDPSAFAQMLSYGVTV